MHTPLRPGWRFSKLASSTERTRARSRERERERRVSEVQQFVERNNITPQRALSHWRQSLAHRIIDTHTPTDVTNFPFFFFFFFFLNTQSRPQVWEMSSFSCLGNDVPVEDWPIPTCQQKTEAFAIHSHRLPQGIDQSLSETRVLSTSLLVHSNYSTKIARWFFDFFCDLLTFYWCTGTLNVPFRGCVNTHFMSWEVKA